MSAPIPDFSEIEYQQVSALLQERYGKAVALEAADSELRLDPASDELTLCPTLYWHERGAHFVVCKLPQAQYRCQFFYADADHYGTGRELYDDLGDCVLTLLRVQADHERQSAGISLATCSSASTQPAGGDDYDGPLVI